MAYAYGMRVKAHSLARSGVCALGRLHLPVPVVPAATWDAFLTALTAEARSGAEIRTHLNPNAVTALTAEVRKS